VHPPDGACGGGGGGNDSSSKTLARVMWLHYISRFLPFSGSKKGSSKNESLEQIVTF
jgi:hypothetical protein